MNATIIDADILKYETIFLFFFKNNAKRGESIEAIIERYSGNKALYKSQKKKKKKIVR